MKSKKIIIIGLSNNSKLAAYYFQRDTEYDVVGYSVDRKYINTNIFNNLPVIPLEELQSKYPPTSYHAFVAVGYNEMNAVRQNLYQRLREMGYYLPNYISPNCTFLSNEPMGDNNFILEDNTIQPFVKIGSNNVLWSGNHIGHDVIIGDNNFITSHVVISGFTHIMNNCFLGVNSTLRDNIKIANKTLIAAGAIIMDNTKEEEVYVPARSVLINKKSTDLKIS